MKSVRQPFKIPASPNTAPGHFTEKSVVFDDNTEIEADIVVMATGYKVCLTTRLMDLTQDL